MSVTLLGTGSADGWPNPFCSCASCRRRPARRVGCAARPPRSSTARCCSTAGPRRRSAAQRAGLDLTGLRHVLLTHAHPDHCAPGVPAVPVLGAPTEPLACSARPTSSSRPGCGWRRTPRCGSSTVAPRRPAPLGGYDVRVLAAAHGARGACVLYDVTGPAGGCCTPPTPARCPTPRSRRWRGAAFDLVLLEETFGDLTHHGTDHLDLATFPEQLRRLRDGRRGHRRHRRRRRPPLAPEPARRRARPTARRPGAPGSSTTAPRSASAGSRRAARPDAGARRRPVRQVAARPSGCSPRTSTVTYVATAYPADHDDEWSERVRRTGRGARRAGRRSRPSTWRRCCGSEGGPLLVDCLTLWLTRVMDRHDAWDDAAWAATARSRPSPTRSTRSSTAWRTHRPPRGRGDQRGRPGRRARHRAGGGSATCWGC